jgi:hypothetical protein
MLIEGGLDLWVFHTTIPLLNHLCEGDKPIEGNVDPLGSHSREEGIQRKKDTPNGVLGGQIPMEEAVKVQCEDVNLLWGVSFNLRVRTDEGPNIKGNSHTKIRKDVRKSETTTTH